MSQVFLSGSRQIRSLAANVRKQLDRIMAKELDVLVGDAYGADQAMQAYLAEAGYPRVRVFFAGTSCRNNLGGWPSQRIVAQPGARSGFKLHALKDRAMCDAATQGLALWDGKSAGTLNNILNLLGQGKGVMVFFEPAGALCRLSTRDDLAAMLVSHGEETLDQLERRLRSKTRRSSTESQLTLT
jgi:hypothetical protein